MARKRKGELPSGNIRIKVYDYTDANKVKHYKSFTAPTKDLAQEMADNWKKLKNRAAADMTIGEVVKDYIDVNEPRLSPTTYRTYKSYEKYFENEPISLIKLGALTNTDVQAFVNRLSLKVSAKTVKNVYQVLKPAVELKREDFRFRVMLPPKEKKEKHIPTIEDIRLTIEACNCPEMKLAIKLSMYGMMRRGEVCALKIEDVDFKNKTISINKSLALTIDNVFVEKTTKTEASRRTIRISSNSLFKEIKALKRKKGSLLGMSPSQLSDRFVKTVQRAKVEPFTFHSLRHFGESTASALNIPPVYIEGIGGWEKGSDVRARTYDHTISVEEYKYSKLYSDKISTLLGENIPRNTPRKSAEA